MEDLVRSLKIGANDYLTKPFYQEEMLSRVHSQLQQKQASFVLQENVRLQQQIRQFHQIESELRLSEQREVPTTIHS